MIDLQEMVKEKHKEENLAILRERETSYNQIEGARVGDFLILPNGDYTRFTHNWGDQIQTYGWPEWKGGSYYLGKGHISFSGGLNPGVKTADIEQTKETKMGSIWFFDRDYRRANGGVYFEMSFRVFRLKEGADLSGLYLDREEVAL